MAFSPPMKRSQHAEIWRLTSEGNRSSEIARALGLEAGTVRRWQKIPIDFEGVTYGPEGLDPSKPFNPSQLRSRGAHDGAQGEAHVGQNHEIADETPIIPPVSNLTQKEEGNSSTVEYRIGHRIRTADEAMDYAEVDRSVWRLKRWSTTYWETGMKLKTRDETGRIMSETPHHTQQWRVHIELERILPKSLHEATEAVFERMKAYSPQYPTIIRKASNKPHSLVMDLFDAHFGKLAWRPETTENYDLRISEQVYKNAVTDILNESNGRDIEEIVFPIGSDFFHIDNAQNTTANGTPQDVDGRLAKILEAGERATIWGIEQAAAHAKVKVKWIPGNHDRLTSYCLARTIAAWFRKCPDVEVDLSPRFRKAYRYGQTLIAFTHGDEEKLASLAGIMANEFKELWALTTQHEWHRGHQHRPGTVETVPVNFVDGVLIRNLRSLSGIDAYHYRKGYLGGTRAAEGFFYCKDVGYVSQVVAYARDTPAVTTRATA